MSSTPPGGAPDRPVEPDAAPAADRAPRSPISEDWLATIAGLVLLGLVLAGVITKGMIP